MDHDFFKCFWVADHCLKMAIFGVKRALFNFFWPMNTITNYKVQFPTTIPRLVFSLNSAYRIFCWHFKLRSPCTDVPKSRSCAGNTSTWRMTGCCPLEILAHEAVSNPELVEAAASHFGLCRDCYCPGLLLLCKLVPYSRACRSE